MSRGPGSPPEEGRPWTPELAYAVGLIALGGVLPQRDADAVVFASPERELHDVLQHCLGVCVPVRERSQEKAPWVLYVTTITSPRLRRLLEEIGLAPARGKAPGSLAVPDAFFRDFFRGCIDGEGIVMMLRSRQRRHLIVRLYSGSRQFVWWLHATVMRLAKIQGSLYRNRQGVWRLDYAHRKGKALLDWMYYRPDLPCLRRKRAKYEEYLRLEAGRTS